MSNANIGSLRAKGFSDKAILDAVHLISYFNFTNRVLDALGAESEPNMRYGKKEVVQVG
jgi:alkylhydroperoxidase family enzyme